MRKWNLLLLGGLLSAGVLAGQVLVNAQNTENQAQSSKLAVVWTSGDADVAYKVCFMYTNAAKTSKWFDEVKLIVWGPSSRLLAGDKKLQEEIKKMMVNGVAVKACVACANMYVVTDKFRQLGIEVKGMGKPLSEMLKSDWKVLTF